MDASVSPPRLSSSHGLSTNPPTDAAATSVIHRQQVEDEAAASSSHSQEGRLSEWQTPRAGQSLERPGCPESEETAEDDPVGAGRQRGQNVIVPVETHTWEEVKGAVWQIARGTSEGAMGYALAILDGMWTDVEERFRFQTRAPPSWSSGGRRI